VYTFISKMHWGLWSVSFRQEWFSRHSIMFQKI